MKPAGRSGPWLGSAFWRDFALSARAPALASCSACSPARPARSPRDCTFDNTILSLILPAISLFIGIAINQLSDLAVKYTSGVTRFIPLFLLGAALGLALFQEKKIFFEASPVEVCRIIYKANPFPESIRIAEYLREHTSPDDTIAVLGSEPQIYFYSHRHSATGYIYTYSLMEQQPYALRMQREMIDEISRSRPKYLVFVGIDVSWLRTPGSERLIFNWLNEYAEENYSLSGLVNLVSPDRTDYYLNGVPEQLLSRLVHCVMIYQRRN